MAKMELKKLIEISVLYGIFFILVGGNIAYYLGEFASLRRMRRAVSGTLHSTAAPVLRVCRKADTRQPLLILVPSFKEEAEVIRQTLLSAALAEYPGRHVVLLIDDPAKPANALDEERLHRARQIPGEISALLAPMADLLAAARDAWYVRGGLTMEVTRDEVARLALLYMQIADWLDSLADRLQPGLASSAAHGDRLFRDKILHEPASTHRMRANALAQMVVEPRLLGAEYDRLADLFRVKLASFERKLYVNLSHAPNKAMNLNSYIGLIGGHYRVRGPVDALSLIHCTPALASLHVPSVDYIITVDADSLITTDYAIRLVNAMEQPGNERIAVAQTPYTAIPDAPGRLEHAAAASTDAQFFTHQGMAAFNASFWVGASALIRHATLRDIVHYVEERGHKVPVFIDDRILIEDAAASLDLLTKGWRVHHEPGRMSYSATPADFGSLLIQRRRWANGGLLILPRLLRHVLAAPRSWRKAGEGLLRSFNLISGAMAGVGMTILLIYPFNPQLVPVWMPLIALPYYLMLDWDLLRAGYRWHDLVNVFALTILLIPANFAGTLHSIRQAWSGKPLPFRRTPKVHARTRTPLTYVLAHYGIMVGSAGVALQDAMVHRYAHMLFALTFFLGVTYGLFGLIGARDSWDDLVSGVSERLQRFKVSREMLTDMRLPGMAKSE